MTKRAIISVYDKTGVVDFARALHQQKVTLISTGGTYALLSEQAGLPVKKVSDVVGFPEILNGRVKTLHPRIHGGLLAKRDRLEHMAELNEHDIEPIDIVVSNLYPFVETVKSPNVTMDLALENIDIGGPTLLRAAAKNFPSVTVISDPSDYDWVAEKLVTGSISIEERQKLASKAFSHVSQYDAVVAQYLSMQYNQGLPSNVILSFSKAYDLRYGENPHQQGALYRHPFGSGGLPDSVLLHGKQLSFNNIMDAHSAWCIATEFRTPTVAIIKHSNPCGLSSHRELSEAYFRAYHGDTTSAYGGIVGFNRTVDLRTVGAMKGVFYEVVVAPDYEPEALSLLKKRRNLRVLKMSSFHDGGEEYDIRLVNGGILVQTHDQGTDDSLDWKIVTYRVPDDNDMKDLIFAWKAVKHVKSNAILLAKDSSILGIGAGQPNRVNSVDLALRGAGDRSVNSVMASDAFFPFPDNVDAAAGGGVKAIIQPGGSIRDQESIDAANSHNMIMVFTGKRHFKH